MSLTITFKLGTDLDKAQVLVQNRVAIAEPRLPEDVRRLGVTTRKSSPDLMMVVHMLSPDDTLRPALHLQLCPLAASATCCCASTASATSSSSASANIRCASGSTRKAVGLRHDRRRRRAALREQNIQVSGGAIGAAADARRQRLPDNGDDARAASRTRASSATSSSSRPTTAGVTRLQDVARIELGAQDYVTNSYLNGKPAVALAHLQRPGTNALATADEIIQDDGAAQATFRKGLDYQIVYNPTEFIPRSVNEVYKTLFEAIVLVVLVVIVFLQTWRAAIMPIVAIPVSLIGTFAVMAALRLLAEHADAVRPGARDRHRRRRRHRRGRERRAQHRARACRRARPRTRTMDEVGGAVIAIALVLVAVFVPTAFIPGISGQFYRQFALTIAVSTVISAFNSLTLSPALAALLLKPHDDADAAPRSSLARSAAVLPTASTAASTRLSEYYAADAAAARSGTRVHRARDLCGADRLHRLSCSRACRRLHSRAGPGLRDRRRPAARRRFAGAHRRGRPARPRRSSARRPGVHDAVAFAGFSGATFTNAAMPA